MGPEKYVGWVPPPQPKKEKRYFLRYNLGDWERVVYTNLTLSEVFDRMAQVSRQTESKIRFIYSDQDNFADWLTLQIQSF